MLSEQWRVDQKLIKNKHHSYSHMKKYTSNPNGSNKLCNGNNIYTWTKIKAPHHRTYVAKAEKLWRGNSSPYIFLQKIKTGSSPQHRSLLPVWIFLLTISDTYEGITTWFSYAGFLSGFSSQKSSEKMSDNFLHS